MRREVAAAALKNNDQTQFGDAKIDARTGRIFVDGFVNQILEGEVSLFLERDGYLDFAILQYKTTED
jgi:hypothetical protein